MKKIQRTLTTIENKISKALSGRIRKDFFLALQENNDKEFYATLLSDDELCAPQECLANIFWNKLQLEIDIYADVLEALTVCSQEKLPDLTMLSQALQVSLVADMKVIERQINLVVPLFYENKPEEYEKKFKKISYFFLDKLAEKNKIFNGNMLSYIFFGDYFSVSSGILLAKHAKLLYAASCVCRMRLNSMLITLAQKENIPAGSVNEIALYLFEKSLLRPLDKEEISLMILYALMQIYESQMFNSPDKICLPQSCTKSVLSAVEFCEKEGYSNLQLWNQALTVTDDRILWNRQVSLITRFLLHSHIKDYSEMKAITYRFILRSFQCGYLSSEIIDFIFDGRTFSNASTVVLAISCNTLKAHNLAPYIQEKLTDMMSVLIRHECPEQTPHTIAEQLLKVSLNRPLNKEELSIFNTYVLLKAFT